MRICHISTTHPRNELRVHLKYAKSCANAGFKVSFLTFDGKKSEFIDGIEIIGYPKPKTRSSRIFICLPKICKFIYSTDYDIYHFHDPEILLITPFFKTSYKKLIFDSHENFSDVVASRAWIPKFWKPTIKFAYLCLEKFLLNFVDGFTTVNKHIEKQLKTRCNKPSLVVGNYPLYSEKMSQNTIKDIDFLYTGLISRARGIYDILNAVKFSNHKITIAGWFEDIQLQTECENHVGWVNVNYLGHLSRQEALDCLDRAFVGIIAFQPDPNHLNSSPNKLFEYLLHGCFVVCPDFPNWAGIIEAPKFGITYRSGSWTSLRQTFDLVSNKEFNFDFVQSNGSSIVKEQYNWNKEFGKCITYYKGIIKND